MSGRRQGEVPSRLGVAGRELHLGLGDNLSSTGVWRARGRAEKPAGLGQVGRTGVEYTGQ